MALPNNASRRTQHPLPIGTEGDKCRGEHEQDAFSLLWKRPRGRCSHAIPWIQNAATRTFSGTNQSLMHTLKRKILKGTIY